MDRIMIASTTRGGPLRIRKTAIVNMIAYLLTGQLINECGPRAMIEVVRRTRKTMLLALRQTSRRRFRSVERKKN